MKQKLLQVINKFQDQTILVIGDIMLDKYIFGDVYRISPEAPVQVVDVTKENSVPGGAANVSNNCTSLGGKALMVGIIGQDRERNELLEELEKRKNDVPVGGNLVVVDQNPIRSFQAAVRLYDMNILGVLCLNEDLNNLRESK